MPLLSTRVWLTCVITNPSQAIVSAVPLLLLSDSTGISAETMGNALLIQFPFHRFDRRLIPFINSREEARKVAAILDAAMDGPVTPLAFTTAAVDEFGSSCTAHVARSSTSSTCT